jgi:hypothetical protein
MLQHFKRDDSSGAILDALDQDGGVIVEGYLDDETTQQLFDDFQPHLGATPWCNVEDEEAGPMSEEQAADFFGRKTKRLHGLLARSPRFADAVTHPLMRAMADRFLRPSCLEYRVSTGELMALGGGEQAQTFHRDADSWLYFPKPRPHVLVSANIALTDFTEENGATLVAPGSHRWKPGRHVEEHEAAKAVMPRGSALLYLGDVLHAGGANQTDEVRIGLYVGFILSWLKAIENHLITNGEAALRATTPEARELLDFTETGWNVTV